MSDAYERWLDDLVTVSRAQDQEMRDRIGGSRPRERTVMDGLPDPTSVTNRTTTIKPCLRDGCKGVHPGTSYQPSKEGFSCRVLGRSTLVV